MKRFLSLFLSIMILLTVFPSVQVFAAKEPTFVVSNAKAEVGDTVEITVSVKNNPGVISMQVRVNYDANALKLVDYKEGDFKGVTYGPKTKNPFRATWIDPLKPDNDTDGVLVKLKFEVLDTAPNGKSVIFLSNEAESEKDSTAAENVFNAAFQDVTFGFENGYVDIKNPDGPKKPTSSQQSNSSVDASVDEETNEIYEQIIGGMLNSNSNTQSDNTDKNTSSTVSDETISTDDTTNVESNDDDRNNVDSQNGWLIWVVVAAIIVLGGAFVLVIVKGKKSKH